MRDFTTLVHQIPLSKYDLMERKKMELRPKLLINTFFYFVTDQKFGVASIRTVCFQK